MQRSAEHRHRVEKKSLHLARVHALAEKLKFLPHLSEDERYLYAWSLAATPDERWRRHEDYRLSVLSARHLPRRESASK